ncbi:hypothetical protein KY290_035632 [Solanum tuberosum]|uniref:Protein kinase domain-containing protein n=1 Tax=Solanum tuberosum TaxID=4113 RepID=A0ABQ7TQQ9_SOLTU|nr:hypothetical protein KY290_035632 [Solanum tuberosum]
MKKKRGNDSSANDFIWVLGLRAPPPKKMMPVNVFMFFWTCALSWNQRFRVIKGVASALVYLHEEWEQVVIHRDVKASNVLLDSELNAKLGDFGLARLYDHGTNPLTTHVVGTVGYLAPEQTRTGKATTISDVYAFGAFLLEVACGRRPIDLSRPEPTPWAGPALGDHCWPQANPWPGFLNSAET